MDDANKQRNVAENFQRKSVSNFFNVGSFFQPIWVRCGSVLSDIMDRKFMESELRFVLYSGSILWIIYLLSQAF
jgi:hypothetical protein